MSIHTYRLTDETDDAFRCHVERLAERWGRPGRDLGLLPSYEPNDIDFSVRYEIASKSEARRFAALVRDARHWIEVHGHHGEDDPANDAKIKRELARVEESVMRFSGAAEDMSRVRRWFLKHSRNQAHPIAALVVIAAAVALFVWAIRSCT